MLKSHVKYNPTFVNIGFEVSVGAVSSRHRIKGSDTYGELARDTDLTSTGTQVKLKLRGSEGWPEKEVPREGMGCLDQSHGANQHLKDR